MNEPAGLTALGSVCKAAECLESVLASVQLCSLPQKPRSGLQAHHSSWWQKPHECNRLSAVCVALSSCPGVAKWPASIPQHYCSTQPSLSAASAVAIWACRPESPAPVCKAAVGVGSHRQSSSCAASQTDVPEHFRAAGGHDSCLHGFPAGDQSRQAVITDSRRGQEPISMQLSIGFVAASFSVFQKPLQM